MRCELTARQGDCALRLGDSARATEKYEEALRSLGSCAAPSAEVHLSQYRAWSARFHLTHLTCCIAFWPASLFLVLLH